MLPNDLRAANSGPSQPFLVAALGQETELSASQMQPLPPPPGSKSEGRKSGG